MGTDPGEDTRVLEALFAGLERLKQEHGISDPGELPWRSVYELTSNVADEFGYDREDVNGLVGVLPADPIPVTCGVCGITTTSDDVFRPDSTHEREADGTVISTAVTGWVVRAKINPGRKTMQIGIRCPNCAD